MEAAKFKGQVTVENLFASEPQNCNFKLNSSRISTILIIINFIKFFTVFYSGTLISLSAPIQQQQHAQQLMKPDSKAILFITMSKVNQ
jgi:hypothetical protein